jgi:hypothetical protein
LEAGDDDFINYLNTLSADQLAIHPITLATTIHKLKLLSAHIPELLAKKQGHYRFLFYLCLEIPRNDFAFAGARHGADG